MQVSVFCRVAAALLFVLACGCSDDEPTPVPTADTSVVEPPPVSCSCDSPGPCQTAEGAACSEDGACLYPAAPGGTTCDDGNACTEADSCAQGVCVAGAPRDCSDGDLCNGTESCDPASGCVDGVALECGDDDPCNGEEHCDTVMGCMPGEPLACGDDDACNGVESCDSASGCVEGTPLSCDDGLSCNGQETCDAATGCVSGDTPDGCCTENSDCEDGNACNGIGFCNMGTHSCQVNPPPQCDDGNPCNGAESCDPASGCISGAALICDDANACNGVELCDPAAGCVDGTAPSCDDGNACNGTETCQAAAGCVLGAPPACDDGDVCNGLEACDAAAGCTPGEALQCDDGLECTGTESCDAVLGCVDGQPPAGCCSTGADCDDGNPCNGAETCVASNCVTTAAVSCDDGNPCTTDSCDGATGDCSNVALQCDDGNACTEEACQDGACVFSIVSCDDDDACTVDSCSAADGCAYEVVPCDDGNVCNGVEICNAKAGCLGGAPLVCDDWNACNGQETCDPASGCVDGEALECSDGNPCNGSEMCDPASGCFAGPAMNCDDGNACTEDSCDAGTWMCKNEDLCAAAMTDGMMVYTTTDPEGNSFACNTCHALDEPSEDGVRRVGHRLGDATKRPSYKNGQLTNMLDAVNSCRAEWMNAPTWSDKDPHWLALYQWLDELAEEGEAPPVVFSIVDPPEPPTGGDPAAGQALFNMACVMCHGTDAVGTIRGPPLAGVGLPESYIVTRVRTSGLTDSPVYDGLTGGIMPFWGGDRLTDEEVKNLAAFVNTSKTPDPDPPPDPPIEPEEPGPECGATHEKVGWTTTLSTKFHGVVGTATVIDDCTIEVTGFGFDGNGIDIKVYAGTGGNYGAGFPVSDQLYNFPEGYEDDTLILKVPEGKTLDDVDGISVWCVAVGVSFGDGLFAAPPDPEPEPGCGETSPKIGWTATLSKKFHGVMGTATIIDDCTIAVDSFYFDGGGIDVQVYAAKGGNYNSGFSVSGQLYNFPIGYTDDMLELSVPDGKSLDDIDGISVWCVAVGVSFGDGLFSPP